MARTEEEMMTGMAAPMEGDMPMADREEAPTTVTVDTLVSNYNAMDPELQQVLSPLFTGEAATAMNQLLGENIVSDFVAQIETPAATPEEEAPAPEGEGMMAPEMPAMAAGGMLNTRMKSMMRQGMTPQEIRKSLT